MTSRMETIRPLHPLFAAEIEGLDLREEPTPALVRTIEDAVARYAVVVVRGQKITEEEHIRFSRCFGPLELPPHMGLGAFRGPNRPKVYGVSNLGPDGEILAPGSPRHAANKANEEFHTDSSFNVLPTKWSLLYGMILPPEGGDTSSSTRAQSMTPCPTICARRRRMRWPSTTSGKRAARPASPSTTRCARPCRRRRRRSCAPPPAAGQPC